VEARQRVTNFVVVIAPLVLLAVAIVALWGEAVGVRDLAIMAVGYVLTIVGITVGFHRFLTHHAFATSRPMGYGLAVLGSMAAQGPVITWVAGHRKHHALTDVEGDPHSPHFPPGSGWRGAFRATWHSHAGWLWSERKYRDHDRPRYARDLLEDRGFVAIDRAWGALVALGLALPAGVGYVLTGDLSGALGGFLWGGVVRTLLLLHVTGSVNSLCHVAGERRFATDDRSTNILWLSLLSFGEAWHHNHHAFPRSAMHGLRPSEPDPAGWTISALERIGLVWDVVRIAPERQLARAA
jgi:stearoyl-CoA desaturase (delta-9 desaturase)